MFDMPQSRQKEVHEASEKQQNLERHFQMMKGERDAAQKELAAAKVVTQDALMQTSKDLSVLRDMHRETKESLESIEKENATLANANEKVRLSLVDTTSKLEKCEKDKAAAAKELRDLRALSQTESQRVKVLEDCVEELKAQIEQKQDAPSAGPGSELTPTTPQPLCQRWKNSFSVCWCPQCWMLPL